MKAARWPAIVVIVGLLVAALLFGDDAREADAPAAPAAALGPVVAKTDALSALWFCNGGTAADNGLADHVVVVVNTTDAPRTGSLIAYASKLADGRTRPDPKRVAVNLAPHGRAEYRLADVVGKAPFASATVEIAGGGVLVEHRVVGTGGADVAPCASSASSTWFVPAGTSDTATGNETPKARELLVFFNPFPGDAVVDVSFSTDTGFRGSPEAFKGLVVPGGSVVGVDLAGAGVSVTSQIAAVATTRSGRVVLDRLQVFDDATRKGLALSTGVASAAPAWVFPSGRLSTVRQERIVVYNPNESPAEVDVEVRPQDPGVAVEPFQLTVRPGQHSQVDLRLEGRLKALIDAGTDFTLVVRSADGSSIVAERLVLDDRGSPGVGVATATGSALGATRAWADVAEADLATSQLVLVNPSATSIAKVRLSILTPAGVVGAAKYASVELQPGDRLAVPLAGLATGPFTVVIEASAPVVAERDLTVKGDRALAAAVPDAGAVSLVELGGLRSLGS